MTACPAAQPPVDSVDPIPDEPPITDVSGTWAGLIGGPENVENQALLTATFEQTGTELSGTATLGPAVFGFSGELNGQLDGNNITFAFSVSPEDNEVLSLSLTGTVAGDRISGEAVQEIEGFDDEKLGPFELERQPTPPQEPSEPDPDPTTFPISEISGTLINWTAGEAFLTLTGGYSDSFTGDPETDGVELSEPAYRGALAADGSFSVALSPPDPYASDPFPFTLTCEGGESYTLDFLALAVASSVPEPTQSDEVLGIYTLGPPDSLTQDAVWLYSDEALELDTSCVLPGSFEPITVALNLELGWNQAILTLAQPTRLESGPVPESFVWSEF